MQPRPASGGGASVELKQRLLFVLGALVVFRVGTFIPVPGIDPIALEILFDQQRGTILDMFNMFSGGALERFSILAIGIMPYISASIIMQLLTHVDPRLKELRRRVKRDGERLLGIRDMALLHSQRSNRSGLRLPWRPNRRGRFPWS